MQSRMISHPSHVPNSMIEKLILQPLMTSMTAGMKGRTPSAPFHIAIEMSNNKEINLMELRARANPVTARANPVTCASTPILRRAMARISPPMPPPTIAAEDTAGVPFPVAFVGAATRGDVSIVCAVQDAERRLHGFVEMTVRFEYNPLGLGSRIGATCKQHVNFSIRAGRQAQRRKEVTGWDKISMVFKSWM